MSSQEKIALSNLLNEIGDKSLQNTLRRVIFSKESVMDAVLSERPVMSDEDLHTLMN